MPRNRNNPPHPPPVMTWGRAVPVIAVAAVFDALAFMFQMFWFFGPAIAALYCTAKVSDYIGTAAGGLLCSATATVGGAFGIGVLGPFGIVMAMATALAGWLAVGIILLIFNGRIFKENALWFAGSLLISEIPIVGSIPAITIILCKMYNIQIKTEKAALKKFEKEQADRQLQERQQQAQLMQAKAAQQGQTEQEEMVAEEAEQQEGENREITERVSSQRHIQLQPVQSLRSAQTRPAPPPQLTSVPNYIGANQPQQLAHITKASAAYAKIVQEPESRLLTKEEQKTLLDPEFLATLETDQYLDIWRRSGPHFVSHVTRQGYRENFFTYHAAGLGKFQNSFVEMLRDSKEMKSKLGREGIQSFSDLARDNNEFLSGIDFNKLEGDLGGAEHPPNPWQKIKLRMTASFGSAPKGPDETSVHLAADRVLDTMYGAETDNQIFMVAPASVVTSQFAFAFNGDSHSFAQELPDTEQKWNDVFIWNKEDPLKTRLSVDASIVFLPKSTQVDRNTGSKYGSYRAYYDEKGKRVIESSPPEITVPAETYWENFFAKNPTLKPKHIAYYDGTPSTALKNFMEKNGIRKMNNQTEDGALGFEENQVKNMREDARTKSIETAMLRQGATDVIGFFKNHPRLNPKDFLTKDDIEEMRNLLGTSGTQL